MKRKCWIWGVLGLLVVLTAIPAWAQTSNIAISPLTFEFTANPGERLTNILKVYNNSDAAVAVAMEVQNFGPTGERGEVSVQPSDNQTFSLARWVSVAPQSFRLEPKSWQAVEFVIEVPVDAEPGGHYGTVLASVNGTTEVTGAAIAQKIGSLLLLQIAGSVQETLEVASFEAPRFSEYGPIIIASRFRNTGTVHLKPRGFILVQNIFGGETSKINLEQKNVLPSSIRRIETKLDRKWLWGKYTATLTAIYGSTNEPLSYTTTFWVVPWRVSLAVGIALLIVLMILYRARRRIFLALKILLKGEHSGRT